MKTSNSSLTSYIFNQINPNFFEVTSSSIGKAVFQIILIIPYAIVLLLTAIIFGLTFEQLLYAGTALAIDTIIFKVINNSSIKFTLID